MRDGCSKKKSIEKIMRNCPSPCGIDAQSAQLRRKNMRNAHLGWRKAQIFAFFPPT
jgi:hypothetical protein